MGSEILLYGYGAVCVCMLVFNIAYSLVMRRRDLRSERRVRRMTMLVDVQLHRIREESTVDRRHIRWLRRQLARVDGLACFDQVVEDRLRREGDPAVTAYRQSIQPVILETALAYSGRDTMEAAYFAYFLSRYRVERGHQVDTLQKIMVDYMRRDNLYCRVNALEALYSFGSVESVAQAVCLLDEEGGFVHDKVLTDGLLSYTWDHNRLIALLWKNFEAMSVKTQLSVLNYIRFQSGDYCREMLAILTDEKRDKELRLAAIRYFGRYSYPPALEPLLAFAADQEMEHWEYAAVSASALMRYPGERSTAVLLEAVHSPNWYVRSDAAASLAEYGLDSQALLAAAGGSDRYAREMLAYRLGLQQPEEAEQPATGTQGFAAV